MKQIITNDMAWQLDNQIKRARQRLEDAQAKQAALIGVNRNPRGFAEKSYYDGELIDLNAWLRALSYQIRWHQKWLEHGEAIAKGVRTYTFADYDKEFGHLPWR